MSDTAAELKVVVSHTDKGVEGFLKKLQEQLVKADQASAKTAQTMSGSLSAGQARAATTAAKVATEQQRLAQVAARVGVEEQRIATEVQRTAAAMARAEQSTLRLAAAKARAAQSSGNAASAASRLQGAWSGLTTVAGTLGIALGAAQLVQSTVELTKLGAQADQVRTRFDGLAVAAGTTGDALLKALRAASGGEISDLNLQLAANRAQMLGVAKTADEFATLMAIARDRAQTLGTSATQAFNDLVTGLGRGSPLILDNLGIMVNLTEANEAYARSVGKSVSQLTEAEQKQALINAVIKQGNETLAATGGAADTAQGGLDRLAAAWENTAARIGAAIANAYDPTTDVKVLNFIASLFPDEATAKAQQQAATVGTAIRSIAAEYAQLKATGSESAAALGALVPQLQATAAASAENAVTIQALVQGYAHGTVSIEELRNALSNLQAEAAAAAGRAEEAARINYIYAGSAIGAADATDAAKAASEGRSSALEEEAAKSLLSAAKTQELTIAKAALEQQAYDAANALIAAGDVGAAKAAQLAQSADEVDQLTAAYYRLGAQAQLAGKIALDTLRIASAVAPGLKSLLPGFEKIFGGLGVGSALGKPLDIPVTPVLTPPKGRKGGGGGKTPKLTEAQKEAQKLLDAQEQYSQDSAELEREHQDRLAEIVADGAKKRREAEEKFAQASLDSRASFYERLGEIEDQGVQQALSAKYEAAVQEANKIAQESGADAADAYLNAAQQAIDEESGLEQKIAEAEKDGDAARAEYYRGVLALRQAANKNELDAIRNHGSDIASETAARYAEEERQYAEHLDKMLATYNEKVGKIAGGGAGVLPPAPGVPAAPGTARPVAAAPAGSAAPAPVKDEAAAQATADGWAAMQDRLSAIEAAVNGLAPHIDGTTGAVRSLAQRGVKAG